VGRRRQVRIAHAHVDDVGPGIARSRLGLVDLLEHVRRQTADAVKIFHGTLCSDNRQDRIGGTFAAIETGLGFGQKSRSIKDLERIQARGPLSSGPAMRLNWVLLPREPGGASFYGVFKPTPLSDQIRGRPVRARTARQNDGLLTSWQALPGWKPSPDGPGQPSILTGF